MSLIYPQKSKTFLHGIGKYPDRTVLRWLLVIAFLSATLGLHAQERPGQIVAFSPDFNRLMDVNEPIVKITGNFDGTITEGPVWNPHGFLIFSDIYRDTIFRWDPQRGLSIFRFPGNYPNANTYDQQLRLVTCDEKLRQLVRTEKGGRLTVLAKQWHGMKLNPPDDVVIRKDDTIYFTDPWWDFPPGAVTELSFQGVFGIRHNGKLFLAAKDFGLPNGLAFSPDENILYINDTRRAKVYAFDVSPDGSLSNRRLFCDLSKMNAKYGPGAVDGMKVDKDGDVWETGPGGVWVYDKTGNRLGWFQVPGPKSIVITTFPGKTINFPNVPANLAWGDRDYKTLYLTAPGSVYRVRTKVRGMITYPVTVR